LFTDIFLFLGFTDKVTEVKLAKSDWGENFWTDLKNAQKFEEKSKTVARIYNSLKSQNLKDIPFFYKEEVHRINKI
jgi:hypothetical protein